MQQALQRSSLVPRGFVVESAYYQGDKAIIAVRASGSVGLCPSCGTVSRRVHSRYRRHVTDLPLSGRIVQLLVIARRFRCDAVLCGRQIFTERFAEGVLAPSARRTARLDYGLLYGHRVYLAAAFPWRDEPANYRLDRMSELRVCDSLGTRPRDFDLNSYAARSFGVFQEEPQDIVLHFSPAAAEELAAFQFHPSQTITCEADGSTTVRFRAGGLREMAWHLFTWGDAVRIIAPPVLKRTMLELLERARSSML